MRGWKKNAKLWKCIKKSWNKRYQPNVFAHRMKIAAKRSAKSCAYVCLKLERVLFSMNKKRERKKNESVEYSVPDNKEF